MKVLVSRLSRIVLKRSGQMLDSPVVTKSTFFFRQLTGGRSPLNLK
jgi:hypothetical protein